MPSRSIPCNSLGSPNMSVTVLMAWLVISFGLEGRTAGCIWSLGTRSRDRSGLVAWVSGRPGLLILLCLASWFGILLITLINCGSVFFVVLMALMVIFWMFRVNVGLPSGTRFCERGR